LLRISQESSHGFRFAFALADGSKDSNSCMRVDRAKQANLGFMISQVFAAYLLPT
jgi:hypothetical protein